MTIFRTAGAMGTVANGLSVLALVSVTGCSMSPSDSSTDSDLSRISMPPGFTIEMYAEHVSNARSMAMSESGILFVGTRSAGVVYALVDTDGDDIAEKSYVIDSSLNWPNGVALKDGSLYVAEISRILRYDDIEDNLVSPPEPVVVYDEFPDDGHHGGKFIAFGPDEKLYVPIGAPCNVCDSGPPYATIWRMNADGSNAELHVDGVRNTVGLNWHPETGELWFTDNGRDQLGDNEPADELNRVTGPGQHFGFPYIHQGDISDPDFGAGHDANNYVAPEQKLGPHVASLGFEFYQGSSFPTDYLGQVFIAEHGSWNRSEKIGYRISMVRLDSNGSAVSYETFAEGWLQKRKSVGQAGRH